MWTIDTVKKIGIKKGWALNPDSEIVNTILDGLNNNFKKHGRYYCPCRVVTGDKEVDKKISCPCAFSDDEVEKDGRCHCQLYFKA